MTIDVRPVEPSQHAVLLRCAEVEVAAFASSHISPVVFPGPFPANGSEVRAGELAASIRDDGSKVFVAVDTEIEAQGGYAEDKAIVGWSKWDVYYEEAAPKSKPRTWGPGINAEAANLMFGAIDGMRDRHMAGRKCVHCHILVIEPTFQGRGIGTKLMEWGIQEAARLGIPAYLESSEEGHRLYSKCGFKDIERAEVSFEKYGLERPYQNWAMILGPPKQA